MNRPRERGAGRDRIARAIRDGFADPLGRAHRRRDHPPRALRAADADDPPGFPVRVMVTRDLVLEPLGELL